MVRSIDSEEDRLTAAYVPHNTVAIVAATCTCPSPENGAESSYATTELEKALSLPLRAAYSLSASLESLERMAKSRLSAATMRSLAAERAALRSSLVPLDAASVLKSWRKLPTWRRSSSFASVLQKLIVLSQHVNKLLWRHVRLPAAQVHVHIVTCYGRTSTGS